jgi:integrase
MPRPLSGSILTRPISSGSRLAYDVKIRSERYKLGESPQWTNARAQAFLQATLLPAAKLQQDWWLLIPDRAGAANPGAQTAEVTVRLACTEYVERLRTKYTNRRTLSAAETPVLKHIGPFFSYIDPGRSAERALATVDEALVSRFIALKREERAALADIAEKLEDATEAERRDPALLAESVAADLDVRELELLSRYGQRGGRFRYADPEATGRISLSTRGLSNAEINRCLSALRGIIARANRAHGLHIPDPTLDLTLPREQHERGWLWPDHLQAMADAARQLDEHGERYEHNGREAAVWVLGLCGPRVGELCAFTWADLSSSGLTVRNSKTQAGRRRIQVPAVARDALEAHRTRLGNPEPSSPIWPTVSGAQRDRHNLRSRLLAPVIEEARITLDARRVTEPLPVRLTPHTFRRTAATYWYWLGRDERDTMRAMGHAKSRMTLEVYAQARPEDDRQRAMVENWMSGGLS